MNELFQIIQREYLTRVRAKSFIIITLLTPILLSSIFLLPSYLAKQHEDYKKIKIGLVSHTSFLKHAFSDSELSVIRLEDKTIDDISKLILSNQFEGIIYVNSDSTITNIKYYSTKQPSVFLQNQIKMGIQKVIVNEKLSVYGIDDVDNIIRSAKESITMKNFKLGTEHAQTLITSYQTSLCMVLGVTIYLFIFLFSSQVMRGVLEEKSNRIVELIITSVSPTKFMAGKIIGIGLLGLTQITCWLVILYCFALFMSSNLDINQTENFINKYINKEDINQILINLNQIDFITIIPAFLFFFIGGYLLYSSLFAAIAATSRHDNDIQQVTLIVTIPLILSVFVLSNTVNSPDSSLSYWFSIIPFTSPIVMMGRVVYGVPFQDILLSTSLLTITIVVIIWLSGKIYRTTILYTGKKIEIKELISWIRNNNKIK
jgi:ABC-2 type transport system permease protein